MAKGNSKLNEAKVAKNDEFYTQYDDIQNEINAYIEYNPDVFRDKVVLLPCDDPEWSNFTKFFVNRFDRQDSPGFIISQTAQKGHIYN